MQYPLKHIEIPEILLLDWDGTLVDSYEFLKSAHNHVRGYLGYGLWDDDTFKKIMKHSTREMFTELYGEQAEKARSKLFSYVENNRLHAMVCMEGAEELLKTLNLIGVKTGVVSNKTHDHLVRDVYEIGWGKYMEVIIGAGKASRDKPAPDPILLALEETGCISDYSKIWYAGDTAGDLQSAKAAGVVDVLLLHGTGGPELVEQYRPLYVFDNLSSLSLALKKAHSRLEKHKGACL
jgi:phosphoglycolate phosphatase